MVKNIIRNTAIALLTLAAACALSMIFQRLDVTEHITTAFVFAVFIISLLTEGYLYGILSAVIAHQCHFGSDYAGGCRHYRDADDENQDV